MLLRASKAHAAACNRSYCIPDDVKFLAPYVLSHRIITSYESSRNGSGGAERVARVVREILSSVPVNEAI
jgi:MoxR-like ATPase